MEEKFNQYHICTDMVRLQYLGALLASNPEEFESEYPNFRESLERKVKISHERKMSLCQGRDTEYEEVDDKQ